LDASREEQGLCPHRKNPAFDAGMVFFLNEYGFDDHYQEDQDVNHDFDQQDQFYDGADPLGSLSVELRCEVSLHVLEENQQYHDAEYQCCEQNKHIVNLSIIFAAFIVTEYPVTFKRKNAQRLATRALLPLTLMGNSSTIQIGMGILRRRL